MTIPPLWQTPYKGRITAMTFGTIFAVPSVGCYVPPIGRSGQISKDNCPKSLLCKELRQSGPPRLS